MNVPECMSIQQIQQATAQHKHLQQVKGYIITGWPEIKDLVQQDRNIIIPEILKTQVLEQLHINHMGIEKMA